MTNKQFYPLNEGSIHSLNDTNGKLVANINLLIHQNHLLSGAGTSSSSKALEANKSSKFCSDHVLPNQVNAQISGVYLQTPTSASSPEFMQQQSSQTHFSPIQQHALDVLPSTPNLRSSPNNYISNLQSPNSMLSSASMTPAIVQCSHSKPVGLGLSISPSINSIDSSNQQDFSKEKQFLLKQKLHEQQFYLQSLQEGSISTDCTVNKKSIRNPINQLNNISHYWNKNEAEEVGKNDTRLVGPRFNNSSNSASSTEFIDSNSNSCKIKKDNDYLENYVSDTLTSEQTEITIDEFLNNDPFDYLSSPFKVDNEFEMEQEEDSISKFIDIVSTINNDESFSVDAQVKDILTGISKPNEQQPQKQNEGEEIVSSPKNLMTKKTNSQISKVTSKRSLIKSKSFNGYTTLLLSKPITLSSKNSSSVSSMHPPKNQISPIISKTEPRFSLSECSNTFPVNTVSNYSFIIENESTHNNKLRRKSITKIDKEFLKKSSSSSCFENNSLQKNNQTHNPKILKNMKSGMTSFQIQLNNNK